MRYVVSDLHGNYELFVKLLKQIKFSKRDTIFILGDIIDKGKGSYQLLRLIVDILKDNAICLMGNHEKEFIEYYEMLLINSNDKEKTLAKCARELNTKSITEDDIYFFYDLPYYYEEDDFILTHAGVELLPDNTIKPLRETEKNTLIYSRTFKNSDVLPNSNKCVIYGHTPSHYLTGKPEIIKYQKPNTSGNKLSDYYKIHLDTGNYLTGVLGCLCLDTCQTIYVK